MITGTIVGVGPIAVVGIASDDWQQELVETGDDCREWPCAVRPIEALLFLRFWTVAHCSITTQHIAEG